MGDLTKFSAYKLTKLRDQLISSGSDPEQGRMLAAVQRELRDRNLLDALNARRTKLRSIETRVKEAKSFDGYALAEIEGQLKENELLRKHLRGDKSLEEFVRDGLSGDEQPRVDQEILASMRAEAEARLAEPGHEDTIIASYDYPAMVPSRDLIEVLDELEYLRKKVG